MKTEKESSNNQKKPKYEVLPLLTLTKKLYEQGTDYQLCLTKILARESSNFGWVLIWASGNDKMKYF